jgi:UDP-N-acetylmuramate dehydrogenase
MADNIKYAIGYQTNWMYLRYFMWNFAGKQNDLQGIDLGNRRDGNWKTGISFLDNIRLGDQSKMPDTLKHNKANNKLYALPLIPGNIGASPMQNIGAYGVELKDVFHSLEAFHLLDKRVVNFTLNDCEFGYRESVFKKKYKDQFAILNVTFRLNKRPQYNISYGAIKEELEKLLTKKLSIQAISQAVINIRSSKLPDPNVIGNAGSFFKNPEISNSKFEILNSNFKNAVVFKLDNGNVKLAAAWLIEQCGWKGYRKGDAGCYPMQPLVLVNYGNATGKDIYELSAEIKQSVQEKFNIQLKREVNII